MDLHRKTRFEPNALDAAATTDTPEDVELRPADTPARQRMARDMALRDEVLMEESAEVAAIADAVDTNDALDPDEDALVVGDGHGDDIVDSGFYSDASVEGLGADLDSMPGDELPISRP